MFASLKNKIKEETGNDVQSIPHRLVRRSGRLSSSASITSTDDHDQQLNDTIRDLKKRLDAIDDENKRLEKTNELLLESVKVAQNQKDIIQNEQEKIQNLQSLEIDKLKNLLSYREQEAVDQLATVKNNQQQIEHLTAEVERMKILEPTVEDLKDELERLRRLSQLEKNNLTTTLAAVEEENRHLKIRLQIVDQSRLETIVSMNTDEKVQALAHERKLLEQHLEEAHLQLSDIKSSWSGQNLALETQLSRLSRQVAEETTEKRKALQIRDECGEKIKSMEFELQTIKEQIQQRDTKIKLLEEEIDELNLALRDCREDSEEEIICVRNKLESAADEISQLKIRLSDADERLNEYIESSEKITTALRTQNTLLQQKQASTLENLEVEKQEKLSALLRNAEISQSEEILRKELRIEREENNELNEKQQEMNNQLQMELDEKTKQLNEWRNQLDEMNAVIISQKDSEIKMEKLNHELNEKNKSIKILNQRLNDIKKTLQNEIKTSNSSSCSGSNSSIQKNFDGNCSLACEKIHDLRNGNYQRVTSNCSEKGSYDNSGTIIMDEVNFKYLKHVVVKFLTSREVEAIHLIRAVATLLQLTNDEEKLLHDTLNWKMSWFGSKPVSVPSRYQQINN